MPRENLREKSFELLSKIALLAVLYCITGAYGLSLALPPGYATIIWPPSGISIGFLLCYGLRTWPGILIGSFLLNCYISGVFSYDLTNFDASGIPNAFVIACGSTVQAIVASSLFKWKTGLPLRFNRVRDIFFVFILAGPLSCMIAATVGVTALFFAKIISSDLYFHTWLTWWSGDVFGVVVFLPLVLIWPTHSGILIWREHELKSISAIAMMTLVIPLFLTFLAWKMSAQTIYEGEYKEFKGFAKEYIRSVNDRLTLFDSLLLNGDGYLQGSQNVDRLEWRQYANALRLSENYPGLAGFGIIDYVKDSDKQKFLKSVRKDHSPDFDIHPDDQNIPYYIIKYIEPFEPNRKAAGLNIAFEENRRYAAEMARDQGDTYLTEPIQLVQANVKEPGFLLLRPVYFKNMPISSIEERRKAHRGWIYAPIYASKLLDDLTVGQGWYFNIRIYHKKNSDNSKILIFDGKPENSPEGKYTYNEEIYIKGLNWYLEWSSTPEFDSSRYSFVPMLNLVIGLVFTGLFAIFLVLYSVYRSKKERADAMLLNANILRSVILDSSPTLIISIDLQGIITSMNATAEDALGYKAEEVVGKHTLGIWHDYEEILIKARQLSEDLGAYIAPSFDVFTCKANLGLKEKGVWTFIRKDKSTFKAELLVTPSRDAEGQISGYIATIMDVSDRIALDRIRERLSLATSAAQIGVWEWLIDQDQFFWTDAMFIIHDLEDYAGRENADSEILIPSKTWHDKIHSEDILRLKQELNEAIISTQKIKTIYRVVTTNGVVKHIKLLAETVVDPGTDTKKMIGVNWDVSAEHEAERIKNDFVSMISHEIRTPLNGIIGTIDIISETRLDDSQKKYVRIIRKSAKLLMDIINDVLDFSKMEVNKLELIVEPFSFSEIIEEHIALYFPLIEEKGLWCKCIIDENIPDMLEGDSSRIKQVLGNLLSNAIKFTAAGGIEIHIQPLEISSSKQIRLKFNIKDTGDGMSAENVERLFKPFTQVSGSGAKNASGTGLGLTISKKIINKMNGEIGVTSELGKGSAFWFTMELKIAESIHKKPLDEKKDLSVPTKFKDSHILIVEDVETNQFVIASMLSSLGFTFDIAGNGALGVEAVMSKKYDCVLMDCMMPVMNGYEATKKIRSLGFLDLPIIALSANALAEDKEKGKAAGMNDYVSKPIVKLDIINVLKKYVPAAE